MPKSELILASTLERAVTVARQLDWTPAGTQFRTREGKVGVCSDSWSAPHAASKGTYLHIVLPVPARMADCARFAIDMGRAEGATLYEL